LFLNSKLTENKCDDEHEDQDESIGIYTSVFQGRKQKFNDNDDDTKIPQCKYHCLYMYVCSKLIISGYLAVITLMRKATTQGGHLILILI
jgi:hypothetical protein